MFNVGMLSNALGHAPIYQDGNASTHGRTQVSLLSKNLPYVITCLSYGL
nr:MAG TPA: hypothetical protein [Caudoviricetes sp.]